MTKARQVSSILIVVCGEAVPALRPVGILPAAGNKGKMPSPRVNGFMVDAKSRTPLFILFYHEAQARPEPAEWEGTRSFNRN